MKHIVRFVENHRCLSEVFALVLSFLWTSGAFFTFFKNIETFNTPKEWKFYFSLIGFLIFFSMSVMVATVIVARAVRERKNRE